MKKYLTAVLSLLILVSMYVNCQETWLDMELWCELEPMVSREGDEFPVPQAEAVNRLLEEARILFSYMIYGGSFTYTPLDLGRQVQEEFSVGPFFEIRWGDSNLIVRSTRIQGGCLYALIRYQLLDFQALRIQAWQSNLHPTVTGRGSADLFQGYIRKITAFENSVKEGVRNYLRQQIYNKPQRINGEFILQDPPYTVIQAGEYVTTSRLKLNIKQISSYNNY